MLWAGSLLEILSLPPPTRALTNARSLTFSLLKMVVLSLWITEPDFPPGLPEEMEVLELSNLVDFLSPMQ